MDQLPRLGKRELICLLLFPCNYVVSVWRGFHFLWVLGLRYFILHSLSLPLIILQISTLFLFNKFIVVSDTESNPLRQYRIYKSDFVYLERNVT